ncbi:uncharacterized protein [Montipora foliosa]|uniref:uncharacterized protein n=1 Tax=Montipora foliosa TaxID=591990 RepID=UPI0035F10D17
MSHPGYGAIFKRIRQVAGSEALKLARTMEKTTYKLEAHHRHLQFTHKALENHWTPKSLRFKPPGNHPMFKNIMERASKHCMRARISICHNRIRVLKRTLEESKQQLSTLVTNDISSTLLQYLIKRSQSVRNNIEARHENKFTNLRMEAKNDSSNTIDRKNWVINLSHKPLSTAERSLLEKGPKFAPTPRNIPVKDIVSEVEAAISRLPDDSKDAIRTTTASLLHRARIPPHKNITKAEQKALKDLKNDPERVITKADKGNCFVVLDRSDYDTKMEALLSDPDTYQQVYKSPSTKIERELNSKLLALKRENKIDEATYRKLHSTDGSLPAIRGSIKHHKPGCPLRPIVSCIGSALYNTSKFLSDILSPIQNLNGYSVLNSSQFAKQVANIEILDDEVMVSFDVVSLFTAIPVNKACDYIRNKLNCDNTLQTRTNLSTDDIISLLDFTLSNNYFVYNNRTYKQIHGCAMGSPVSPIVANLCMEVIEESAISSATVPPRIWKRYVDDSFVVIKKAAVHSFHDTLNAVDPKITFTIEEENNGQIAFLDTLVSRKNGVAVIDVYRKPTHTDRYLDFSSHHERKHISSTASTLLFRASNLPSTNEGKSRETNYVTDALKANGYPSSVISYISKNRKKPPSPTVPSPEELVAMFFSWVDPQNTPHGFACLPYISGLTEPLMRLLRKHEIRVVTKPLKTLQQEFPSPKTRQPLDQQCNVVYKIPCSDCPWSYIGETGRCFLTRKKEHQRNLKNFAKGSNIASHAWKNDHSIDFNNACVIDKGNYRVRKTLESWHTAKTVNADNNSKPLPRQYSILL